jgi:predicted pyridoxine 5'-phosphate oxidase superfamily flavin-nucleotide-binding protein
MSSVYHSGELAIQKQAHAEAMAIQNGRIIGTTIPEGAISFIEAQPMIIAATVDEKGKVWSSILTGNPGFIYVEDEVTLTISYIIDLTDPLVQNLKSNSELGLLVIDFNKRMRMRINGKGSFDELNRLVVKTEQVYGNCSQYIQKRTVCTYGEFDGPQKSEQRSLCLNKENEQWISNADTFFIGSVSSSGKVDVSHRGGLPGFINVTDEKTLIIPDYSGNKMFNTLGNIHSNPNTGILFVDFANGHSLQLTGTSKIIWDQKESSNFPGAERLVVFKIDEVIFRENCTKLTWDFVAFSPSNPHL